MSSFPGPNNQIISQSYIPPIRIPQPGTFRFVDTEQERLALSSENLEGVGVVQFQPSASLYTLHEGYWYLIGEGEGAEPTYYTSDILNDSTLSGSTLTNALNNFSVRYSADSGSLNFNINNKVDRINPSSTGSLFHSGSSTFNGVFTTQQSRRTQTNIISGNLTLSHLHENIICNPTGSGSFTVALPAISGTNGLIYTIKNKNTGTVIVDANGSELIDGFLTYTLLPDSAITITSDGVQWNIT